MNTYQPAHTIPSYECHEPIDGFISVDKRLCPENILGLPLAAFVGWLIQQHRDGIQAPVHYGPGWFYLNTKKAFLDMGISHQRLAAYKKRLEKLKIISIQHIGPRSDPAHMCRINYENLQTAAEAGAWYMNADDKSQQKGSNNEH
jgi:hypothetical protein